MAAVRLHTRLKVVEILIRPQCQLIDATVGTIDQILEHNYRLAKEQLNDGQWSQSPPFPLLQEFGLNKCITSSTRWLFCCLCMETALDVDRSLTELAAQPEQAASAVALLSLQQQRNLSDLFQLIVALAVLPNLLANVGIPVQKRSKFFGLFKADQDLADEQKYSRLRVAVGVLCRVVGNPELSARLLLAHLSDMLAALLQICHAPLKKPTTDAEQVLWNRLQLERQQSAVLLENLLQQVQPPLLVRSLLLLQGPPASHAKIIRDAVRPAPLWLVRTCARLLSRQLVRPNGLLLTVQGVLNANDDPSQGGSAMDAETSKRCDSLARIIATPPAGGAAEQGQYWNNIGPQLLDMARRSAKSRSSGGVAYARVASACYRHVATRYGGGCPALAPLLRPLDSDDVDVQAEGVETLHGLFVAGCDPQMELSGVLPAPTQRRLLRLYRTWHGGVLHARALLEELLVRLLRHTEDAQRLPLFQSLWSLEEEEAAECCSADEFLEEDDRTVRAAAALLQVVADAGFTHAVYLSLLQQMPNPTAGPASATVLEPPDLRQVRRSLLVLQLVGEFSQDPQLQHGLVQQPQRTVDFAVLLLDRAVRRLDCRSAQDPAGDDVEAQTLSMVFTIVAVLVDHQLKAAAEKPGQRDEPDAVWTMVQPLVAPLRRLAADHPLDRVRSAADDLRVAIQTRGFLFDASAKSRPVRGDEFQTALKELDDPLVPVQGHALLTLTNLLKKRDPQTFQHKEQLLVRLLEMLEHDDSYVYLTAVQALAALADADAVPVLDALIGQLHRFNPTTTTRWVTEIADDEAPPAPPPVQRPPEVRLKVGEVLLKVVRQLGPLAPHHKRPLLDAFLRGARDPDAFVRASSLSNLGELCALLRYSIDPVLHELFNCVSQLVQHDKDVEVRRAAVLLLKLLLQGLDTDALKVLEPIIRDVYRLLKAVVVRDSDDSVVTFHAGQALQLLADIVLETLNAPSKSLRPLRLS